MIGAGRCRWLLILPILGALSWAGCGRRPSPEAQEPAEVAELAPQQELAERVIPVFCYHDMSASATGKFEVATEDFKQHLQLLHDEGFESITASQLAGYYEGKVELPQKAVALTFDDGPRSILTESKPLMDEHGFVGTAFLITESVGAKGQLTWEDVAALQEAGWEIGSHTVSHVNPTKVSAEEWWDELADSKATIEERTSSQVTALAYPFGNYDEQVMRQAREAGYRVAFSIDRGPADNTDDPMRLPRQMVVEGNSMRTFKRWVHQEKLHFADLDPPIGQRVETTSPTFTARVADEAIPLSDIELTVEDRPPERQSDEAERTITFTPELAKGANIVRANYWGSPQREVSWIVVCEAE
jgi:peptidoglycan/xylan/chitin deacetylase (PgdA/CDA1 family)